MPGGVQETTVIWTNSSRPACEGSHQAQRRETAKTSIYGVADALKPNFVPRPHALRCGVATKEEYVGRAAATIMRLLDEQHALVKPEVVARVSEGSFDGAPDNIDPHHVTTALTELARSGRIIRDYSASRGGAVNPTFTPADQHRRTTKIEKASARKRLLAARYNGWGHPNSRYPRGLIGPAGETATREALTRSGQLQPAVAGFGETAALLGVKLTGAVDSAGHMVTLDAQGLPGAVVTIPIEVKNIRSWIYPSSIELYQVLDKAAVLQQTHPDRLILPILVCRKAHKTAYWMGSQLGFMVIDTGIQYLGDNVEEEDMLEVRNELYFNDLHLGTGPSRRVQDRFTSIVPQNAVRLANLWRDTCAAPTRTHLLHHLRHETDQATRDELVSQLRAAGTWRGGW